MVKLHFIKIFYSPDIRSTSFSNCLKKMICLAKMLFYMITWCRKCCLSAEEVVPCSGPGRVKVKPLGFHLNIPLVTRREEVGWRWGHQEAQPLFWSRVFIRCCHSWSGFGSCLGTSSCQVQSQGPWVPARTCQEPQLLCSHVTLLSSTYIWVASVSLT